MGFPGLCVGIGACTSEPGIHTKYIPSSGLCRGYFTHQCRQARGLNQRHTLHRPGGGGGKHGKSFVSGPVPSQGVKSLIRACLHVCLSVRPSVTVRQQKTDVSHLHCCPQGYRSELESDRRPFSEARLVTGRWLGGSRRPPHAPAAQTWSLHRRGRN